MFSLMRQNVRELVGICGEAGSTEGSCFLLIITYLIRFIYSHLSCHTRINYARNYMIIWHGDEVIRSVAYTCASR